MAENQDINIKINIDTGAANATVKAVKESLGDISKVSKEINKQREDEIKTINNVATANANALKGVEKKLDTELKGLKGMRIEYKELLKQLDAAAAAGDTISFKRIESELGALRNDISDTAKRMKMLDPGEILGGWVKFGQGVVGAYSAITAAADLFGSENEQLQEIERKSMQLIQLMMGLEQARQILIDGGGRAQLKALVETTAMQYKKIAAYITEKLTITAVEGSTKAATVAQRIWNVVVAQNPLGLMAAAAVAVGLAVYGIVRAMRDQNAAQKEMIDSYAEAAKSISTERSQLELYLGVARDSTQSLEARRDAIKNINDISPKYLSNITLENINTTDATKAINNYNIALENKAKQQALVTLTSDKYAKIIELEYKNTVEYWNSLSKFEQFAAGNFDKYSANLSNEKNQLLKDIEDIKKSFNTMFSQNAPVVSADVKALRIEADKLWDGVIAGSQESLDTLNKLMGTTFTLAEQNTVGFAESVNGYIDNIGVVVEKTEDLTNANNKNTTSINNNIVAIDNYKGEMEKLIPIYQIYIDQIMDTMELSEEQTKRVDERVKQMFATFTKLSENPLNDIDERVVTLKTQFADLFRGLGDGLSGENTEKLVDGIARVGEAGLNAILEIRSNKFQEQFESEKSSLEKRYQNEIKLAGDNEMAKENIDKKYETYRSNLEKKQAKQRQKEAITQAIINGAMAITNIWATTPKADFGIMTGVLTGLSAITTAMQVAVIKSQKFARGGVLRGPSHANGGIMAGNVELEGNEGVINKRSMSNPALANIASAVNVAGGGIPLTNNTTSIIDYDLLAMKLGAVVNDIQVNVLESDITKTQKRVKVIENKNKF